MTKAPVFILSILLLTACSGAEEASENEASAEGQAEATEFDQELTEEEANAALDALDAEEAAQE